MADKFCTQNVDNPCKTTCKTPCESRVYFCAKSHSAQFPVYKTFFSLTFPHFSTHFPTATSPLIVTNFFHYST